MKDDNWKAPAYITGGILGLIFGVLTAHFYARTVEESTPSGDPPNKITTGDIFKLGLTAVGLMRSVSDLGKPPRRR
jgi:hypothetical protein